MYSARVINVVLLSVLIFNVLTTLLTKNCMEVYQMSLYISKKE